MDLHSITKVSFSQVVGLAEAVDEAGGQADVARIAAEVEMDLDRIGPIVAASEFLGLVTVDSGTLRLTELSHKVLKAGLRERKKMLREILKDLPAFRYLIQMVEGAGRPVTRKEVVDTFALHFGTYQSEDLFRALVYWGRYSELVAYDSRSEQLSLRVPGVRIPSAH